MIATQALPAARSRRLGSFLLLMLGEALIFAIIPLSARPGWMRVLLPLHAGLTAAFLAAGWLLARQESTRPHAAVTWAFGAAGAGILASTLWHMDLTRWFGYPAGSPQELSIALFFQSFIRVAVIVALMALTGAKLSSFYLCKGRLGFGLALGGLGFLVMALIAFLPMVKDAARLLALLPWILLFVLSNGFAEELLYRGLLLPRYEPFLGKGLSNWLAALVFTLLHIPVDYVPAILPFLAVTFGLALLWGLLMQKSGSLWGSALFHAGADCVIIFGIFATA